ncbi:hypothetical protein [Urechidicola croceus]|uniref:Uncharacterized protein n=1 Tax=Urechidicola croceus TaxID=1850246 RepID=A0A1D8P422_9FLAO|nr:hypothetical protein [Urechidicola croceus]AOW19325.1 hypothetical protein LPB138_00905 [Urechidicola croceus]
MKKILLPLLIIGFILVSCKKNNLSDSYWIAVKSYPNTENKFNYVLDGMIINFSDDIIEISNALSNYKKEYKLSFDNKNILLNDTLWSTVFKKYEDSLILDFEETTRVKFVRLDKKHSLKKESEFWKHRNWILSTNAYQRELILTDSMFFDEPNTKLCIQKDLQDNQFISTIDKWNVVNINGNQLFVKTFHQMDKEFYRIKRYVGDSIIELESLEFPNVKTDLRKRQYISEFKREEIIEQIQNHVWRTDRILSLDTLGQGSRDWDLSLIKLESLKEKKLSFKFSKDSTYNIYESDISVRNGNWTVSQTGNEIILNNEIYPSDYVDLINVDSDSLVIGSLRRFEPKEDNYGMDVEMYFKIKLIK